MRKPHPLLGDVGVIYRVASLVRSSAAPLVDETCLAGRPPPMLVVEGCRPCAGVRYRAATAVSNFFACEGFTFPEIRTKIRLSLPR
jgi:hypothetical protein